MFVHVGYFGIYCNASSILNALYFFNNNLYSDISYEKIISNATYLNLIKQISLYDLYDEFRYGNMK